MNKQEVVKDVEKDVSPTSTISTNSDENFEKILTLGKHVKALTKLVKNLQEILRTYKEKKFQNILNDDAKETLNQESHTASTTEKLCHIS